jgi:hypothetical protein
MRLVIVSKDIKNIKINISPSGVDVIENCVKM